MGEEMSESGVNPFQVQGTVRDQALFFGRKQELQTIWGHLSKGQNVSIVADRQRGKSSLLWHIKENAPVVLEKFTTLESYYLDMQIIQSGQEFFQYLAKILNAENTTGSELNKVLSEKRVVLCLDEFDRTAWNKNFSADFFSLLRGLSYLQFRKRPE